MNKNRKEGIFGKFCNNPKNVSIFLKISKLILKKKIENITLIGFQAARNIRFYAFIPQTCQNMTLHMGVMLQEIS